jgi:hypothetical protein
VGKPRGDKKTTRRLGVIVRQGVLEAPCFRSWNGLEIAKDANRWRDWGDKPQPLYKGPSILMVRLSQSGSGRVGRIVEIERTEASPATSGSYLSTRCVVALAR